jgi:peptidoglycan/xylan/chitin deacetylase (PgdA/CDA1 family)
MRWLGSRAVSLIGVPRFLQSEGARRSLTIVAYHGVVRTPLAVPDWGFLDETAFRRQVHYLARHFDVVPLSAAAERLRDGRLNAPTAAITFDDGFQNTRDVAFPILREAGLPATVFLITSLVGTDSIPWFCRLHQALGGATRPAVEWNGLCLALSGPDTRVRAGTALRRHLKRLRQPDLLAEVRGIVAALGADPDGRAEPGSPFRMLTREAVGEMAASGLIEFGGHTHTHAILSRLTPDEQRDEIERSLNAVRHLTGRPCTLFAYPNGKSEDFDGETVEILASAGVRTAVTAVSGPNGPGAPLLRLGRCSIGATTSMGRFRLKVHHWEV